MTAPAYPEEASSVGLGRLADATAQFRDRRSPRAVEVANDVLAAALRASRRSLPLRAQPPHTRIWVSDQVLVSRLRQAIDDLPRLSVGKIFLQVGPDAVLHEITIELYVQYGEVLMDVADRVREVAGATLAQTLGAAASGEVAVAVTHIHVSDVTIGDPHDVDPADERL